MKNFIYLVLLITTGFASCRNGNDNPVPVYYEGNKPFGGEVSADSANEFQSIPVQKNKRPTLPGKFEIIVNSSDTFVAGNFKPEGYAERMIRSDEPERFTSRIHATARGKYTVNLTLEINTTISPAIGIHYLGWHFNNYSWYTNTHINEITLTSYEANQPATYEACFGADSFSKFSVSSPYYIKIDNIVEAGSLTLISGSFEAEMCKTRRDKSKGFNTITGVFTNVPMYISPY